MCTPYKSFSGIWEGDVNIAPKIAEAKEGITMKLLPYVDIYQKAQNQKKNCLTDKNFEKHEF